MLTIPWTLVLYGVHLREVPYIIQCHLLLFGYVIILQQRTSCPVSLDKVYHRLTQVSSRVLEEVFVTKTKNKHWNILIFSCLFK